MCPVYINRIASIHAESRNEKPYFSAQEPDYKEMITNANLRRRMSRMIKMGVACGLECLKDIPSEKVMPLSPLQDWVVWPIRKSL